MAEHKHDPDVIEAVADVVRDWPEVAVASYSGTQASWRAARRLP